MRKRQNPAMGKGLTIMTEKNPCYECRVYFGPENAGVVRCGHKGRNKINRCRYCQNYPQNGRGREVCTLLGIMVYASDVRECFKPRGEV